MKEKNITKVCTAFLCPLCCPLCCDDPINLLEGCQVSHAVESINLDQKLCLNQIRLDIFFAIALLGWMIYIYVCSAYEHLKQHCLPEYHLFIKLLYQNISIRL